MIAITRSLGPVRAPRGRFVALALLAAFGLACSSAAATAPTVHEREALAQQLDSERLAAHNAGRAGILDDMLQFLALGAPIDTVTISTNGRAGHYPTLAATVVQAVGGRAFDSVAIAAAWHGDPIDTIFFFAVSNFTIPVTVLDMAAADTTFFASQNSITGQIDASAPFGACTNLRTQVPADVSIPAGVQCQRETLLASMSAPLEFTDAPIVTIDLPEQSVKGVRLVFNAP